MLNCESYLIEISIILQIKCKVQTYPYINYAIVIYACISYYLIHKI